MAIKSSGSLSFADIRNEFGGLHQPPSGITTEGLLGSDRLGRAKVLAHQH